MKSNNERPWPPKLPAGMAHVDNVNGTDKTSGGKVVSSYEPDRRNTKESAR